MELICGLKLVDVLTLFALFFGPVIAVGITLWKQDKDRVYEAKHRLFTTLMSHRKSPPTAEWAAALNLIDVVYALHPKVLGHWATIYGLATQQQTGTEKWNHEYLLLLESMARVVGYGPRFMRISKRCIRYRRGDVKEWLRQRGHRATAEYAA